MVGLGFSEGRPGLEQVYAARFAAGGQTTGQNDWQMDGGKKRLCEMPLRL